MVTLINYIYYDAVLAFVVTFLPVVLLTFGTFNILCIIVLNDQ